MKNWSTFLIFSFFTSFALAQNTVVDVIVNSSTHATLETAVIAAGLDDDLAATGPFTVFAPTDAAFDLLPDGVLDALLMNPTGDLADILMHHVVSGSVASGDLSDNQVVETLFGKNLIVNITAEGVFINDALVSVADVPADNGIVHVIDAVLIPTNTVLDVVLESEAHTTLEAAILAAELDDDLSGEGPFTLFAPTDAAFDLLPDGTVETLLQDPTGTLANILLHHVVAGSVASGDLSDNQVVETLFGKNLIVNITAEGVFINDALVSVADVPADNGIVHVIDAVLIPTNTVLDVVLESEAHTTLEAAILAAELDDDLSGEGPFTLFAPTDAAFDLLPDGTVETLLQDPTGALANILLHHVVSGSVASGDLSDNQVVETLFGKNLIVNITAEGVFINDALVSVADVPADNGIVHVIDAVLIPTNTVLDVVLESEAHTTLEAAILAAELDDDLSGEGPFTLFAPTDAAFDLLPDGTVETLLQDPTGDLASILLYHVLNAEVLSTSLTDGQMATTIQEEDIMVSIDADGMVMINNALVTMADISAQNGVVHVINAVILPPSLTNVEDLSKSDFNIQVFPNPVSSTLNINISEEGLDQADVFLWNIYGQKVRQWSWTQGSYQVNVSDLPTGNYFLEFRTDKGRFQQQVLINK